MLSTLGFSFATSLSDLWNRVGPTIGGFLIGVITVVLAIVAVEFVLHFIQKQVISGDHDAAQAEDNDRYWNERLGGDKY